MIAFVLISYIIALNTSNAQDIPVVLGHRGAAGLYPEHTKIAYEKGADYADYIECDVQVTKVNTSNNLAYNYGFLKHLLGKGCIVI